MRQRAPQALQLRCNQMSSPTLLPEKVAGAVGKRQASLQTNFVQTRGYRPGNIKMQENPVDGGSDHFRDQLRSPSMPTHLEHRFKLNEEHKSESQAASAGQDEGDLLQYYL